MSPNSFGIRRRDIDLWTSVNPITRNAMGTPSMAAIVRTLSIGAFKIHPNKTTNQPIPAPRLWYQSHLSAQSPYRKASMRAAIAFFEFGFFVFVRLCF